MIVGAAALAIAAATLYLGRRDLTRPPVVFGVMWFGCVALARLRLMDIETSWAPGFTALVFAGGLAFILAALLAGGTAPARRAIELRRDLYRPGRLVIAAAVLYAGAVAGQAYKSHGAGGIPLLSGRTDALRQATYAHAPAWATFLTDGFFIGMWCALLAQWLLRGRLSRGQALALWLLAAAGLFGTALMASRNTILLALAVPLVAVYLLAPLERRSVRAGWAGLALAIIALVGGGLFVARIAQKGYGSDNFLHRQLERQPALLRPLVPFYLNAGLPLEAGARLYRAVPDRHGYTLGGASLLSLPAAAFPEGKPNTGAVVAGLMEGERNLTWTVATYQGRLYLDLGPPGVVLGSLLLGLLFGALYRWAREHAGLVPVALVGYLVYYAAYMTYDNYLSATLIAVYDLAAVAGLDLYARGVLGERLRSLSPIDERAAEPG